MYALAHNLTGGETFVKFQKYANWLIERVERIFLQVFESFESSEKLNQTWETGVAAAAGHAVDKVEQTCYVLKKVAPRTKLKCHEPQQL